MADLTEAEREALSFVVEMTIHHPRDPLHGTKWPPLILAAAQKLGLDLRDSAHRMAEADPQLYLETRIHEWVAASDREYEAWQRGLDAT